MIPHGDAKNDIETGKPARFFARPMAQGTDVIDRRLPAQAYLQVNYHIPLAIPSSARDYLNSR
jgi:hypothetical protein